MDKESQRYKILAEIQKYQEGNEETTASLFVIVDAEDEYASHYGVGKPNLLLNGFSHIMKGDPEFNKTMKALMGVYLLQNPKEKESFLNEMEMLKDTFNTD